MTGVPTCGLLSWEGEKTSRKGRSVLAVGGHVGAVGLTTPTTATAAAVCLTVLLVQMPTSSLLAVRILRAQGVSPLGRVVGKP